MIKQLTPMLWCVLVLLCSLFSPYSMAAPWSLTPDMMQPKISASAKNIEDEVNKLPELIFQSSKNQQQVKNLLAQTLLEIQNEQRNFGQMLQRYRSRQDEYSWHQAQALYLSLHSLSQSKQNLLARADSQTKRHLTGFGPDGVRQFKAELSLTLLNAQFLGLYQIESFKQLLKDVRVSPIPVLFALFKILIVLWILRWWLKQSGPIIQQFRRHHFLSEKPPSHLAKTAWYILKAHRPIAFLIAITISLRILSGLPSLQHLQLLDIFIWWILGGSIAVQLILEFVYRNRSKNNPELTKLRLSSIRYYVWSFIIAGVTLQLAKRTIGEGTIYYWISHFMVLWFVIVTIIVLRKWKDFIFEFDTLDENQVLPVWVRWAQNHKNDFGLSSIATIAMAFYRFARHLKFLTIACLSRYTIFRQLLAYLFRIEVAKQTDNEDCRHLLPLDEETIYQYVLPGHENSELIAYADAEIEQLGHYILSDTPALCVISGERGVGTTTVLKRILSNVETHASATPVYLNCPNAGYQALLTEFALQIGLSEETTEIQLLGHLRKSEICYVIAIDNCQRLVKPKVGGLTELLKLTNLIRRSKKNHRAILAIEKSSWRFVDRARGERLLFDLVKMLPRWSEVQIGQLFDTRLNKEHPISFEGLNLPKQWDQDDMSEEERTRTGLYKVLWHYADGNPSIALRFFRLSLRHNTRSDKVVLRLFNAPQAQELDSMPKPMLAILRAIVQLEVSTPEELAQCTQLGLAEVIGCMRFFESRGYVEWRDEKARISDHWYRYITNTLHRQHLLVK